MNTYPDMYSQHLDLQLLRRVGIYTFVLGLFAHAYCFSNYSIGFDVVGVLTSSFENFQIQWKVILGRFIQPLNFLFRGATTSPWLLGILALCWFSLANYVIIKLFDIKSTWMQLAICGLTCTHFSCFQLYANYIHEADTYALAFFLSVLAVYTFDRCKWGLVLSIALIFTSLGLYQTYLATSTVAMMLLVLKRIDQEQSVRSNILFAGKALASLLIGLSLYYGFVLAYIDILGISTKDGTNDVTSLAIPALVDIPQSILATYGNLAQYLLTPDILTTPISICNAIIFLSFFYLSTKWCRQRQTSKWNKVLFISIILLLPFVANLLFFLTGWRMHDLMRHPYVFLYLAMFVLAQMSADSGKLNRAIRHGLTFLTLCIIGNNIIIANQLYLFKDITHQRDLLTFTKITSEIERQAFYRVNETPVLFIGDMTKNPHQGFPHGFANLEQVGLSRTKNSNLCEGRSFFCFARNLTYPIQPDLTTDASAFSQRIDVLSMPCFPQPGYCRMIEGRVVVKISD